MITLNNSIINRKPKNERTKSAPIYSIELNNTYLEDELIHLYKKWLEKTNNTWSIDQEPCVPIGQIGPSIVFGHYLKEELNVSSWSHVLFQHVVIPEKQYRDILSHLDKHLKGFVVGKGEYTIPTQINYSKEKYLQFVLNELVIEESLKPFLENVGKRANWSLADLPTGYTEYYYYLRDYLPIVPISVIEIKREYFNIIPKSLQDRYQVICFGKQGTTLYVATANPQNREFEDLIIAKSEGAIREVVLCGCAAEIIVEKRQDCLKNKKQANISLAHALKESVNHSNSKGTLELDIKLVESLDITKEVHSPETVFQWILYEAIHRDVTDIHIEHCNDRGRVRFRLDGDLFVLLEPSFEMTRSLVTVCKNICSMSSNLFDNQDSAFSVIYEGQKFNLRVNAIPFRKHFQKIALRILPRKNSLISLNKLGLGKDHLNILRRAITRKQGLILITGPTGEGKTTTLYAALSEINKPNINIQTIEDPIEREIEGINQTAVNLPQDITFSKIMRSIVRQDPNVILLGEIRDQESAELAIEAALTGHLVFSTLHANSAIKAIQRLIQLKVPHYLLADSLILIQAQRLVKRLCNRCKKPKDLTPNEKEIFSRENIKIPDKIYEANGCLNCYDTGYSGRVAIMEMVPFGKIMATHILNKSSFLEIQETVKQQGARNLYQDALLKCSEGLTSLSQTQLFEEVWV